MHRIDCRYGLCIHVTGNGSGGIQQHQDGDVEYAHTLECKPTKDNTRRNGHEHFVLGGKSGLSRLYHQIMQKFHHDCMQSKTLYQDCLPDHDDDGYGVVHLFTHVFAHHPSMAKDRTGAAIATNPRRLFWFLSIFLWADGTQYTHLL
jgi:hypothetical protein